MVVCHIDLHSHIHTHTSLHRQLEVSDSSDRNHGKQQGHKFNVFRYIPSNFEPMSSSLGLRQEVMLLLCAVTHTKGQTDFFVSVTDLAGWRESWFRDISVDPKRCSLVVASAGHSLSQCSKVCWPAPHVRCLGLTKALMTCRYSRSQLL